MSSELQIVPGNLYPVIMSSDTSLPQVDNNIVIKTNKNMAESEKSGEEKIGSMCLIDGKQNYRRQPKQTGRKNSCSSSRIWVFFTIFFLLTTIGAVAAFIWRHFIFKEEPVIKPANETILFLRYKPLFRLPEEQRIFAQEIYRREQTDAVPTSDFVQNDTVCNLNCTQKPTTLSYPEFARPNPQFAGAALGTASNNGCCQSQTYFQSPNMAKGFDGSMKTLVQDFYGRRQYFRSQACRQVSGCSGCTCTRIPEAFTALVINPNADDDDDDIYVIEFIKLLGCCKCLN